MNEQELSQEKLKAEIAHLITDTSLISKKTKWYEFTLGIAVAGLLMAAGKYLL